MSHEVRGCKEVSRNQLRANQATLVSSWTDRVLAKIHLADEVNWIGQERLQAEQRLRRLVRAYIEGLYSDDDYTR